MPAGRTGLEPEPVAGVETEAAEPAWRRDVEAVTEEVMVRVVADPAGRCGGRRGLGENRGRPKGEGGGFGRGRGPGRIAERPVGKTPARPPPRGGEPRRRTPAPPT